ncbi:MAG: hypothetical protein HDS92_00860 [Bacteroidales bacterium]|nr:hypothetical protein [Bacteroidales bacterium]
MSRLLHTALLLTLLLASACGRDSRHTDVIEFGPAQDSGDNAAKEDILPYLAEPEGTAPGPMSEVTYVDEDRVVHHWSVGSSPRLSEERDLTKVFNDSNFVHLVEATRIGISPLTDTRSFWRIERPLVRLKPCADFDIAELTHSVPYLIPEGAEMVHEIGRRFNSRVAEQFGGAKPRIRVSSVLRTPGGIRKLRRVNRNAVAASVHQMATTIDITYNNFSQPDGPDAIPNERLKAILASVLDEMRAEGRLWVKYEVKQPCFHITVRATDASSR